MKDYSYIFNAHPQYIDGLYEQYLSNPDNLEQGWRQFFEGFDFASRSNGADSNADPAVDLSKEFGVLSIIHGFRSRGHLLSTTNPIRKRRDRKPHLDLADYNLSESQLDQHFAAAKEIGLQSGTLNQILDRLTKLYSGNIGFEYTHIENWERRMWLRDQIEGRDMSGDYGLDLTEKKRILEKLNGAVVFEKFLHTKYVGQKRFSLEGGETTIAALDTMINSGAESGVQEVVIGMAHRGRLNVLANTMGKTYETIFNEFEGTAVPDQSFGDGDVKYHLGFSSQVKALNGNNVNLKLTPNPSHLESVDPVVQGYSRAKIDILYKEDPTKLLPILIHGDAAVVGQGVVYETAQMNTLAGYATGGTIHFIINNQIGFTTDFDEARSSTYCTAAALGIEAPVFHVNGDDPEAVVWAIKVAVAYRQKFHSDVFVDMVCYRRHGHNEGDDPKFTQPHMYDAISKHANPREIYMESLSKRGDLQKDLAKNLEKEYWDNLQNRLDLIKQKALAYSYQEPEQAWKKLKKLTTEADFLQSPITGITKKSFDKLVKHLMTIPEGFEPLGKVNRLLKGKQKLIDAGKLDWAYAELLAYGSLMMEGNDVRLSGQDVRRGTFSHRHAVFYDKNTEASYNRLNTIQKEQGKFRIYNSLLSEFAVLGFEYGYSLATPDALVIWEAQFGDFYNGAQTIIDQYVTAAESKWRRMSGLVMLLPHGYEGQGPEHSSARLERFLQSCAEFNMTVANITSPANFFHALRRQLLRPFRKPLVVMSPKSLLRHPLCVSDFADFTSKKKFQEVIDDSSFTTKASRDKVKRILFCSGKIYYDLLERKNSQKRTDVAIVRIEQLYPYPDGQIHDAIDRYENAEIFWVQEEPANMGAWSFIALRMGLDYDQLYSRKASASPATGFKKVHDEQQQAIVDGAFG